MKAALFDMDGLILDTESIFLRAACEIGCEMGVKDLKNVSKLLLGLTKETADNLLYSYYGDDTLMLRKAMAERRLDIIKKDGIAKKKGIDEILCYLKQEGYKTAVVSSTDINTVRENLESTCLLERFDLIVGGDSVQKSKPEPDIYLYACEKLGVTPENAIGFEDSHNGIRALYAAKIKAFMILDHLPPTDEMYQKAYAVCDSLTDALDIIKKGDNYAKIR